MSRGDRSLTSPGTGTSAEIYLLRSNSQHLSLEDMLLRRMDSTRSTSSDTGRCLLSVDPLSGEWHANLQARGCQMSLSASGGQQVRC